jgi:hypothetical protein
MYPSIVPIDKFAVLPNLGRDLHGVYIFSGHIFLTTSRGFSVRAIKTDILRKRANFSKNLIIDALIVSHALYARNNRALPPTERGGQRPASFNLS